MTPKKGPYTYIWVIHTEQKRSAVRASSSLEKKLFGRILFEVVKLLRTGTMNLVTWVLTCAQSWN
jgi:hypothetical protein